VDKNAQNKNGQIALDLALKFSGQSKRRLLRPVAGSLPVANVGLVASPERIRLFDDRYRSHSRSIDNCSTIRFYECFNKYGIKDNGSDSRSMDLCDRRDYQAVISLLEEQ